MSGPSLPDLMLPERYVAGGFGYNNAQGRVRVDDRAISRSRLGVIVNAPGQSNATNTMGSDYTPVNSGKVLMHNVYDGAIYQYRDPALGASGGQMGHHAGALADALIDAEVFDNVVVSTPAIGATSILDWTPESGAALSTWMWPRIVKTWNDLHSIGLDPSVWQVMIGEQDAGGTTTQAEWVSRFNEMVGGLRALGSAGYVIVPRETWQLGGLQSNSAAIRAAQLEVVNPSAKVIQGPDLDTIGNTGRGDGTHFNITGRTAIVSMIVPIYQAII